MPPRPATSAGLPATSCWSRTEPGSSCGTRIVTGIPRQVVWLSLGSRGHSVSGGSGGRLTLASFVAAARPLGRQQRRGGPFWMGGRTRSSQPVSGRSVSRIRGRRRRTGTRLTASAPLPHNHTAGHAMAAVVVVLGELTTNVSGSRSIVGFESESAPVHVNRLLVDEVSDPDLAAPCPEREDDGSCPVRTGDIIPDFAVDRSDDGTRAATCTRCGWTPGSTTPTTTTSVLARARPTAARSWSAAGGGRPDAVAGVDAFTATVDVDATGRDRGQLLRLPQRRAR